MRGRGWMKSSQRTDSQFVVLSLSLGQYLLGDLSSVIKCQGQLLVARDQPFLFVHILPQLIIS